MTDELATLKTRCAEAERLLREDHLPPGIHPNATDCETCAFLAPRTEEERWHDFKVTSDGKTVRTWVDGVEQPIPAAAAKTETPGGGEVLTKRGGRQVDIDEACEHPYVQGPIERECHEALLTIGKRLGLEGCDGGATDEPCYFPRCLADGCDGGAEEHAPAATQSAPGGSMAGLDDESSCPTHGMAPRPECHGCYARCACPDCGGHDAGSCEHCPCALLPVAPPSPEAGREPQEGDVWRTKDDSTWVLDGGVGEYGYHGTWTHREGTRHTGWCPKGAFTDGTLTFVRPATPRTPPGEGTPAKCSTCGGCGREEGEWSQTQEPCSDCNGTGERTGQRGEGG